MLYRKPPVSLVAALALMVFDTTLADDASPMTYGFDLAAQPVYESNAFWGLAQTYAPQSDYDTSIAWLEAYGKPWLKAERVMAKDTTVYGGVALLGTATVGDDVFQQGDTGRLSLEEAYLGVRGGAKTAFHWDMSVGQQTFKLGEGLLLSVGAGNGFERGAVSSAPRRAWELAGLVSGGVGPWRAEGFYLDPNELDSGETNTRLLGGLVEWSSAPATATSPGAPSGAKVGIAYFKATKSNAPYPKAPVQIVENGRDGLETWDAYWKFEPTEGLIAGLSFSGEYATQRNPRIDMDATGYGAEIGWRFTSVKFMPKASWSHRYFSGDDPSTSGRLERFDALYYDGAPPTWSSGGNGSLAFYNSNLKVDRLRVDLVLSQTDFINLNYWDVRVAEINSPVQYGQAARLLVTADGTVLVSGFPKDSLSRELYFEHTHVFGPKLFATWGVTAAFPQQGVEAVVTGSASDWWGVLANFTYKY